MAPKLGPCFFSRYGDNFAVPAATAPSTLFNEARVSYTALRRSVVRRPGRMTGGSSTAAQDACQKESRCGMSARRGRAIARRSEMIQFRRRRAKRPLNPFFLFALATARVQTPLPQALAKKRTSRKKKSVARRPHYSTTPASPLPSNGRGLLPPARLPALLSMLALLRCGSHITAKMKRRRSEGNKSFLILG
ncbi:hypothetical protein MRX96_037701 [Rhipicephalus microplus]